MANFKQVNRSDQKEFPDLHIDVVRGTGYVYFSGDVGFGKINSIMAHPTSTTTEDMIRICISEVEYSINA
jgi:hypothetical protein